MAVTFVLGGARSGKTAHALGEARRLAAPTGRRLVMVATAEALDDEMAGRISRHQAERGPEWETREAPRALAAAVRALADDEVAVIDCLTLWLSNLMLADADLGAAVAELCEALSATSADVVVVSNEVGQGIVPDNPLARRFRDEAGWANQAVARLATHAVFVVAGLPLALKA
jgi:adenosylcobinamide kinase / adenosylcobinamide-phosphate guanylyltransferase